MILMNCFDLLSEVDDFSTLLEEAFASLLDDSEAVLPEHAKLALQQTKEPHRCKKFFHIFSPINKE